MAKNKTNTALDSEMVSDPQNPESVADGSTLHGFIESNVKARNYVTGKAFAFWIEKIQKIDPLGRKSVSEWEALLENFLKEKT